MLLYKHESIDLLPLAAQKQKRDRKIAIRLAIFQVAIFLCLLLLAVGLARLSARAYSDSARLLADIYIIRQSPEVAAAHNIREQNQYLAAEEVFLADHMPYAFEPTWLGIVLYVTGESLVSIDYDGIDIFITGYVDNFHEIEDIRLALSRYDEFETVGMGNIRTQGDGQFFFDLRLSLTKNKNFESGETR